MSVRRNRLRDSLKRTTYLNQSMKKYHHQRFAPQWIPGPDFMTSTSLPVSLNSQIAPIHLKSMLLYWIKNPLPQDCIIIDSLQKGETKIRKERSNYSETDLEYSRVSVAPSYLKKSGLICLGTLSIMEGDTRLCLQTK